MINHKRCLAVWDEAQIIIRAYLIKHHGWLISVKAAHGQCGKSIRKTG